MSAALSLADVPDARTTEPLPRIVLPWKVLVPDNGRHGLMRVKGHARIVLTAKYRNALAAGSMLAAAQWKRGALKSSVALTITLYEPDKRRRDVGNYCKLLCDVLVRVAFVDDSQIDELTVRRGTLDRVNPRAEIEIRPR